MGHPTPVVLVVDDEPTIRLVATDALGDAGFEVVEASSADHALALLQSRPDVGLLFTDVNMPGEMNGLELARLVHERWPNIAIVVTSGRGAVGPTPANCRFLTKPYELEDMTRVIARLTGFGD